MTAPAAPPATRPYVPERVGAARSRWDAILAADPGLGRLQTGWRTAVSMVTGLATGYGMALALGAPVMFGLMVGGMQGMITSITVGENTPGGVAKWMLWTVVPFCCGLGLSAALHNYHTVELVLLVLVLAGQMYMMRLGKIGLYSAAVFFSAYLTGVIVGIPPSAFGGLAVIAVVVVIALVVARLVLCNPMPREDLIRTQRAFVIEARRFADAAASALDVEADPERAVKRMQRALARMNVVTLTVDGRLAQPESAADPDLAEQLHQYLFDAELALQGVGKAVQEMDRTAVSPALREALVVALVLTRDTPLGRADALRPAADRIRAQAEAAAGEDSDQTRAQARRVADLLDALAGHLAHWLELGQGTPSAGAKVPFQTGVALEGGRPAGAASAAQRVAADGKGPNVTPAFRAAVQAAVAGAIVLPIAEEINSQKFYWGIIGVMIALTGTSTTHERVRKTARRLAGTVIGAVLGIALHELIGTTHVVWSLVVIVAAVAVGAWGMQRQYAIWVAGLVTALVQLYGFTTPGSLDWLLTQRFIDNGVGMVLATLAAALILPLSTGRILRETERGYIDAVKQLLDRTRERWSEPDSPVRLRGAARAVDAAHHQLQAAVRPVVRLPRGVRGRSGDNLLALFDNATSHARRLARTADTDIEMAPRLRVDLADILATFSASLDALDRHITSGDSGGEWTRVTPLIRDVQAGLRAPGGPSSSLLDASLGELAALDESLASLSATRGMRTAPLPVEGAARPGQATAPQQAWAQGQSAPARAPRQASVPRPTSAAQPSRPAQQQFPAPQATPAPESARPAQRAQPQARSAQAPTSAPTPATAPPATSPVSGRRTPAATPGNAGLCSVTGTVRCANHLTGHTAWITVVSSSGQRRARVRAVKGDYEVTGLEPGSYTLIAAVNGHTPQASFVLLDTPGRPLRHDFELADPDRAPA